MHLRDFRDISEGMQLKIVDQWVKDAPRRYNLDGLMDCYLSAIVTVKSVEDLERLRICEDNGRWKWFPEMVECIVADDHVDEAPIDENEFMNILFVQK